MPRNYWLAAALLPASEQATVYGPISAGGDCTQGFGSPGIMDPEPAHGDLFPPGAPGAEISLPDVLNYGNCLDTRVLACAKKPACN